MEYPPIKVFEKASEITRKRRINQVRGPCEEIRVKKKIIITAWQNISDKALMEMSNGRVLRRPISIMLKGKWVILCLAYFLSVL
ncbi:unnamed protein product [Dovyalis caffra]|uniref:Uncharacterized protein n=1 Tax=Dovyalis caffra TaxID=77055 RepID=A0AAV1R381_9ROSI|nr:unnamed protein product [Dovyalis caffra]